jgi:hypothetical protein
MQSDDLVIDIDPDEKSCDDDDDYVETLKPKAKLLTNKIVGIQMLECPP